MNTSRALPRRFVLVPMTMFVMTADLGAQTSPSDDGALGRLRAELERFEPLSGGSMGVAAIHLETGRAVYLHADEPFPMASTYKVPIAVQLMTRVDRGELSLSDMIEVHPEDLHPGSGTISRLFDDPGVVLSVRNLLELMLLISDNSATDLTLEAAGGGAAVTERMRALGIEGIRVDRPTSRLIADYVGVNGVPEHGRVSPEEWEALAEGLDQAARARAAEAFAHDVRDTSSPRAMAELLRMIWEGTALSAQSTETLLDVMRRVETGEGRIKGVLPPRTDVAHKTGTIGGTTNDVGIIYLPGDAGHVVTVVFVKDSEIPVEGRERAIAQASRAIYDFFLFNPGT
ncbi:MAG: class A beta-lactamase [Gemmatimonadota bacterium]|nr:class A beta-lactamase [Gemmatimonadota bacterium]